MDRVRYMISDAAGLVNVESHVLRYWEEELELDIPRNELGHRYYTQENIREFQQIKELKEKGYQLHSNALSTAITRYTFSSQASLSIHFLYNQMDLNYTFFSSTKP